MTPVQGAPRRYRLELRLWVMLSVAMALAATASTLAVLYLQRPFIAARGGLAPDAQNALFAAAVAAGGLAGLAGLALGVAWSRRIWAIVARTDAAVPSANGFPAHRVPDELGALDAAFGRLTLSMDRFVSDSDILARLPAAMLLGVPPTGTRRTTVPVFGSIFETVPSRLLATQTAPAPAAIAIG